MFVCSSSEGQRPRELLTRSAPTAGLQAQQRLEDGRVQPNCESVLRADAGQPTVRRQAELQYPPCLERSGIRPRMERQSVVPRTDAAKCAHCFLTIRWLEKQIRVGLSLVPCYCVSVNAADSLRTSHTHPTPY